MEAAGSIMRGQHNYWVIYFLISAISTACGGAMALSITSSSQRSNIINRRVALTQLTASAAAACGFSPLLLLPLEAQASLLNPQTDAITTVTLDSADDRIGIELADVSIGTRMYPAVRAVQTQGQAFRSGVVPGMVLIERGSSSEAVVNRIQNGPYPIVLQFYNLAQDNNESNNKNLSAEQALAQAQEQARRTADTGPPVSSKGTGLVVKTIRKGDDCNGAVKAKRGDTLVVNFQARVASPGGPIFDEGSNARFTMGTRQVVNGVDIGLAGMCPGEIRTLDIPSSLGFGPRGSEQYDVPGDVRLWWKVELIDLIKKM